MARGRFIYRALGHQSLLPLVYDRRGFGVFTWLIVDARSYVMFVIVFWFWGQVASVGSVLWLSLRAVDAASYETWRPLRFTEGFGTRRKGMD